MRQEQPPRTSASAALGKLATVVAAAGCLAAPAPARADEAAKIIPAHPDGSRTPPVHRIQLFDHNAKEKDPPIRVRGKKAFPAPYSTRVTCNKCHEYDDVAQGWHFNAMNAAIDPGRRGEPWILVDRRTATQVPLSYRKWPGAFRPDQLNIKNWEFVQEFGRQMPGGGIGEKVDDHERFDQSGVLQINCAGCHNPNLAQDQTAWAVNVGKYNFKWAATAAGGLAHVAGNISTFPPTVFDVDLDNPDHPEWVPMTVEYFASRFDSDNYVIMDFVRRASPRNCYFCHSTQWRPDRADQRWRRDKDVHLAAGLTCTDCHRNDICHHIVRGFEGEKNAGGASQTLTCRGCHLGDGSGEPKGLAGRLGAPYPRHVGLPTVHLDKLSCTVCHSGPWPSEKAGLVQTSRSHAIGVHGKHTADPLLPYIVSPVYMKGHDGRIAPHHVLWPAYWARLREADLVCPLPVARVAEAGEDVLPKPAGVLTSEYGPPTAEQIAATLAELAEAMKKASARAAGLVEPARKHAATTALLGARLAETLDKSRQRLPEMQQAEAAVRQAKQRLAELAEEEKKAQDQMLTGGDAAADKAEKELDRIEAEVKKLQPKLRQAEGGLAAARKALASLQGEMTKVREGLDEAQQAARGLDGELEALGKLDGASRAIAAAGRNAVEQEREAAKEIGALIEAAAKADTKAVDAKTVQKRNAALLAAVSAYKAAAARLAAAAEKLAEDRAGCRPGYLAGGKLYALGADGKLAKGVEHAAAEPYAWPFAHEVRSAGQSMGAMDPKNCTDCHSADSPLFFGEVAVKVPAPLDGETQTKRMCELLGEDETYWKLFNLSFTFRPMLKIVALVSAAIIGAIVLLYGSLALRRVLAWIAARAERP